MHREDMQHSGLAAEFFRAAVDRRHTEHQDRYARRRDAFDRILSGDYVGAEAVVRSLLRERFEVSSTHCHLSRILLMTGREAEAREQIARAWEARDEAPTYVVARILFFQCLFAMFDGANPAPIVAEIKATLDRSDANMDWTVLPMLHHVRAQLGRNNFQFMRALGAALSVASGLPGLDNFPLWRDAATTSSDVTTELTPTPAAEQGTSTTAVPVQDEQGPLGFRLARRIIRRRR